jgi:ribosomal protein S18 acetylase RimI-like enzyme
MTIEVLTVSADDWQVWRSMRLAALTDAPGAFGSRLRDWADAAEGRWRERLSIPGAIDLLAVDSETKLLVGMATGTPHPHNAEGTGADAELISMWVDPAARGRGVATALITAITHWAASAGARCLTLSVMPNNDAARRIYERNGFAVVPTHGNAVPNAQCELVMVRTLQ